MTTPRRKRYSRAQRLQAARTWVRTYRGRDIVRGYRRWYGVDTITAILELRQLGIGVSETRFAQAKETERQTCARRIAMKEALKNRAEDEESDEMFAYIAGYTPNGVPFGVTWEELATGFAESFDREK
jgi:hypothetical protein